MIYPKLSLTELSIILERTKATISHHLKKLTNLGILKLLKRKQEVL
ncbi:MAG: ArsR family transcriptional regulator [Promethearchaeota archaeon]